MSETKVQEDQKRVPYSVQVTPSAFEPDCSSKFISSVDFCRLVNAYMRAAFDDFYGCEFDMVQGFATINVYFDHVVEHEAGKVYACEQAAENSVGNDTINRIRNRDSILKNGDRYFLTPDGKDIIKPLLSPRYYNQGNPQWKNIVADVNADNRNMFMMQPSTRRTKVVGLDPQKLCSIIWGAKEDNDFIDYGIAVMEDRSMRNMPIPGAANHNYVLQITKAYNGNLKKTCEKFGIANAGSNIVC